MTHQTCLVLLVATVLALIPASAAANDLDTARHRLAAATATPSPDSLRTALDQHRHAWSEHRARLLAPARNAAPVPVSLEGDAAFDAILQDTSRELAVLEPLWAPVAPLPEAELLSWLMSGAKRGFAGDPTAEWTPLLAPWVRVAAAGHVAALLRHLPSTVSGSYALEEWLLRACLVRSAEPTRGHVLAELAAVRAERHAAEAEVEFLRSFDFSR